MTLHRPLINPGNFCHITSLMQFLASLDSETIQSCFEAPLSHALEHVKGNIDNEQLWFDVADMLAQHSNGLQGDPNDNLRYLYSKKLVKDALKIVEEKRVEDYEALILDTSDAGLDVAQAINSSLGSHMIFHLFGGKYLWCEISRNYVQKSRSSVVISRHLNAQTVQCGLLSFRLKAVVVHKGASALGGHYVCCVAGETPGEWFVYDDNSAPRKISAENDVEFNTSTYFGGDTTIGTDATLVLYELV